MGDVGGRQAVEHRDAVRLHGVAHEQVAEAVPHELGVLDEGAGGRGGRQVGREEAVVALAHVVQAPPLNRVKAVGYLAPVVAELDVGSML